MEGGPLEAGQMGEIARIGNIIDTFVSCMKLTVRDFSLALREAEHLYGNTGGDKKGGSPNLKEPPLFL